MDQPTTNSEYIHDELQKLTSIIVQVTQPTLHRLYSHIQKKEILTDDEGNVIYSKDVVSLYMFYVYTAKWQTDMRGKYIGKLKATNAYAQKGTGLSKEKFALAKKVLVQLDIIENCHSRTINGEFEGWYIIVKHAGMYESAGLVSNPDGWVSSPVPRKSKGVVNQGTNTEYINNKNTENNINNIYTQIFDHWNSQGIYKHTTLNDKTKRKIASSLKEYKNPDEILKAITNYATVYKGNQYFWNYKWSLADFLQRGLSKFVDEATPLTNFLSEKSKKESNQQSSLDILKFL